MSFYKYGQIPFVDTLKYCFALNRWCVHRNTDSNGCNGVEAGMDVEMTIVDQRSVDGTNRTRNDGSKSAENSQNSATDSDAIGQRNEIGCVNKTWRVLWSRLLWPDEQVISIMVMVRGRGRVGVRGKPRTCLLYMKT